MSWRDRVWVCFSANWAPSVIKVENIKSGGDVTRQWKLPTEETGTGISGYFSCVNWGKQSIAIDITTGEGLDIVYSLDKDKVIYCLPATSRAMQKSSGLITP
jgi:crotonobetainyl-CoA:carnitine CoA-transferase CaiB-like acyl-CoA transferase